MAKRDIKQELQNNAVISGFDTTPTSSFIAPQQPIGQPITQVKQDNKKTPIEPPKASDKVDSYKYRNGVDKTQNYGLTFKIDADIEQFLKNIEIITFIETMKTGEIKSTTKYEYVNNLIRQDMLKRLGLDINETDPNVWIDAYKKFSKKNGIKDKPDNHRYKNN